MIIIAVISFLVLTPTFTAGAQEAQTITGTGTIMGTASLTVHFSPAGGSFTGSFSQSSTTGECPSTLQGTLEGTFDGGDGGRVTGSMHGTRASEKCSIETGASGSFSGNLFANGSGKGTMMVDISGGESGEVSWQVSFSPEAFKAANNQTFDEYSAQDISNADGAKSDFGDDQLTISKIYGDVTVSDPSVQRGILDKSYKLLGAVFNGLTGREDDPEPWRVRVDPEKGMYLTDGFQLKTGDGRAVIQFKDGTKFIIREGSTATFSNGAFTMETGNYYYSFAKQGKKIYLKDRRAKWSIIGTQFEISTNQEESVLKVYEGTVEAESLTGGGKKIVSAGKVLDMDNSGFGNLSAMTGESPPDFAQMEKEIIDSEQSEARTYGLYMLGILLVVLAAVAGAVVLLFLRKRKSKAGTTQAPNIPAPAPPSQVQAAPAPPSPVQTAAPAPPAPVQDAAVTTEAPTKSLKYCTKCGGSLSPGDRFCGHCGAEMN